MKLSLVFIAFSLAQMVKTNYLDFESSKNNYTRSEDDDLHDDDNDFHEKPFSDPFFKSNEDLTSQSIGPLIPNNVLCLGKRDMKIFCQCFYPNQRTYITDIDCWILAKDLNENDNVWEQFLKEPNLLGLKLLVQNDGQLDYIPRKLFNQLTKLKSITIEYGNFLSLPTHIFSRLKNLNKLELRNNQIRILDHYSLSDMPNLLEASLENNFIYRIDKNAMRNLYSLLKLSLSYNNINNLNESIFIDMGRLKILDLSYNHISYIKNISFIGLSELEHLKIDHNSLTELPDWVFTELWRLIELNLDNNLLRNISARTFDGLNSLQTLTLRNNQLIGLGDGIFRGITALRNVYLRNNSLVSVSKATFDPVLDNLVQHPGEIETNGNYLICDCKLQWVLGLTNVSYHKKFLRSLMKFECWLEEPELSNFKEPVPIYISNSLKAFKAWKASIEYETKFLDIHHLAHFESSKKKSLPNNLIATKSKRALNNNFKLKVENFGGAYFMIVPIFDLKSDTLLCPPDPAITTQLSTTKSTNANSTDRTNIKKKIILYLTLIISIFFV